MDFNVIEVLTVIIILFIVKIAHKYFFKLSVAQRGRKIFVCANIMEKFMFGKEMEGSVYNAKDV